MLRYITIILCLWTTAHAGSGELPTPGPVVNIVEWDGNNLPPVYERSDQLPVSKEELIKLSIGGFDTTLLTSVITQRRYAGDVSADGLIALREAGLPHEAIKAASLHALPPNRAVNLTITLEIDGKQSVHRSQYLYIIVPDGEIERVFTADLDQVFGRKWRNETAIDNSDLLIPRTVRSVSFAGRIPLKSYGSKSLSVFTSTRPDVCWISEHSSSEEIREHAFEYPASSLTNDCRLLIRFYQDRVLEDNWKITGSHLECEWN